MKLLCAVAVILQVAVVLCVERNNYKNRFSSVPLKDGPSTRAIAASKTTARKIPYCGRPGCPSRIHYAADNMVTVYVNGVNKGSLSDWRLCGSASTTLKTGDVVALQVKDYGVWYGAIASFYQGGKYHSTGVDDWRAVKAYPASDWKQPTFNACAWPPAVVRPGAGTVFPGKASCFPYNRTGANYVWASNAGESDEIYLRYRIGGEGSCRQKRATIEYSADDAATVFVNGEEVSSHDTWETLKKVTYPLRKGDVVSIVAQDKFRVWYGAVATITIPGLPTVTTGSRKWKAKEVASVEDALQYTTQSSDSCCWKYAVLRPNAGVYNPGKAQPFPYPSGARYVWAEGVRFGTIILRHVIGGEDCWCK